MRWLALAALLVGSGGCLGVDSPDGALICSTQPKRACPEGFYCLASSNRCWRLGHFPADMATPGFDFPPGNDDMSVPNGDDLSLPGDDLSSVDDLSPPNDDLLQSD